MLMKSCIGGNWLRVDYVLTALPKWNLWLTYFVTVMLTKNFIFKLWNGRRS